VDLIAEFAALGVVGLGAFTADSGPSLNGALVALAGYDPVAELNGLLVVNV
jgi:hypothetical protein